MAADATTSCSSPGRDGAWLVRKMRDTNYGRIEGLLVTDGRPVPNPPPRLIRTIKLSGKNGPRSDVSVGELAQHPKMIAFFEHLAEFGNGLIHRIVVQEGLPELMDFEDEDAA